MELTITYMSGMQDGQSITISAANNEGQFDTNGNWFITLGRLDESDISLGQDNLASRNHARIYWRNHNWWLEDCNSRNGTFLEQNTGEEARVNGVIPIRPGQLFRTGRTWLRIEPSDET